MELGCEPLRRRYYLCQITCADFPEVDSVPTNPYPGGLSIPSFIGAFNYTWASSVSYLLL